MLVIANWKLNLTQQNYRKWLGETVEVFTSLSSTQIVLAPSFTELSTIVQELFDEGMDVDVSIFAQDVSRYAAGAYTGEVSAAQLAELFVSGAIIGHSERRLLFHETDEDVIEKVRRCVECDIQPLVAVSTMDQVKVLSDTLDMSKILIAFEPLSAIGTGNAEDPEVVETFFTELHDQYEPCGILYGGSVSAETVDQYLSLDGIDGFLVGTASVDPSEFVDLLEMIENH